MYASTRVKEQLVHVLFMPSNCKCSTTSTHITIKNQNYFLTPPNTRSVTSRGLGKIWVVSCLLL